MLSIRLWKRQNHLHGWWRLFCRFDLEGEILGKSSELASSPKRHQLLSPKPRRAGEAQAGPVASWSLQTAGDQLADRAQAPCAHNRRYLQTQQGLAPGQWFQGQAGSMCFQRAAESLSPHVQMRRLAGPGCRAMGWLPSACVCVHHRGLAGKKRTACRSIPGGTGRLIFPRLTCMRTIFKNRFSKSKFPPNPQGAESTASSLYLLLAVGLEGLIWTLHYSDFLSDDMNGWKPFSHIVCKAKVCNM